MNLKEYLAQQAEEEISSVLTEEDKAYCRQIAANSLPDDDIIDRRKRGIFLAVSMAVFITALIIMLALFIPKKNDFEIRYFDENIVSQTAVVSDLNDSAKGFELNMGANIFETTATLHYDSLSNDKLYYMLELKGFNETADIVCVINENYSYPFEDFGKELYEKAFSNYILKYSSYGSDNERYIGYIEIGTEKIYITSYVQNEPLGDRSLQAFFDYVQSIIKVK